jgi:hypothetical protein
LAATKNAEAQSGKTRKEPRLLTFEPSARSQKVQEAFDSMGIGEIAEVRNSLSQPGLLAVDEKFDLAFVDGDHSFTGALLDILLAGRLLHEQGIIVVQDAISQRIAAAPEVEEAILTAEAAGWCDVFFINTSTGLAILRKTEKWPTLDMDRMHKWIEIYEAAAKFYHRDYREFMGCRDLWIIWNDVLAFLNAGRVVLKYF